MKDIERLDLIRRQLAGIRPNHVENTKLYYLKKAEYELLVTNFVIRTGEGKSLAEKERIAKQEFYKEYEDYKKYKAEMEGYDREFRNLDAQRSILMVKLKSNS